MRFLQHLQERPEHERKRIALGVTIVIFAWIMAAWIIVEHIMSAPSDGSGASAQSLVAPFQAIFDAVKSR